MNNDTLPVLSPQDWALLRTHVRRVEYPRGAVIRAEGSSPRRTLRSVARRLPTDGRQARILSPFVGVRATKRRSVSKRPSGVWDDR